MIYDLNTLIAVIEQKRKRVKTYTDSYTHTGHHNFTRNNCAVGYTGSKINVTRTVTRQAISEISQEDAKAKAKESAINAVNELINKEGQNEANTIGVCTLDSSNNDSVGNGNGSSGGGSSSGGGTSSGSGGTSNGGSGGSSSGGSGGSGSGGANCQEVRTNPEKLVEILWCGNNETVSLGLDGQDPDNFNPVAYLKSKNKDYVILPEVSTQMSTMGGYRGGNYYDPTPRPIVRYEFRYATETICNSKCSGEWVLGRYSRSAGDFTYGTETFSSAQAACASITDNEGRAYKAYTTSEDGSGYVPFKEGTRAECALNPAGASNTYTVAFCKSSLKTNNS